MITGLVVLKMVLMPSRQRLASLENSGPRWSMIGVSMARRMRSGSGVGPGMCRKWRPEVRDEFFDMIFLRFFVIGTRRKGRLKEAFGPRARRLAAMNGECEGQIQALSVRAMAHPRPARVPAKGPPVRR